MIELGKRQKLKVVRMKEFGVYLGEHEGDEAAVLLPKNCGLFLGEVVRRKVSLKGIWKKANWR